MGIFGVVMNFVLVVGLMFSGLIVEYYLWCVLFFMMFLIVFINVIVVIILVKNVMEISWFKLDVFGVILLIVGFGGLFYVFVMGGIKGWISIEVLVMFIVGGILILFFIFC